MCFLQLNIKKFDVINSNWVRPTDKVKWRSSEYLTDMFTTDFLNKLSTISEITGVMIFNKINHSNPFNAHIDIELINEKPVYINYGLNFVFDDSTDINSTMRWYTYKRPWIEKKVLFSAGKTAFMNFTMEELILDTEHSIDEYVTLVRTDIPHTIFSGNGLRTCISIRFKKNYDWDTATNLFNKTFNQ